MRISTLADSVLEVVNASNNQLPQGAPLRSIRHKGGQYVFRRKIDEAVLRQQNAQNAWLAIQALPDETLKEIRIKRQRIRSFCREYPNTEPYDDALRSGRDLEHKDELLSNWNSEFGLLDFIRKDTAYRGAAQERLEELQKIELLLPEDIPDNPIEPPLPKKPKKVEPSLHPDIAAIVENMVRVEGGSFIMGCQDGRDKDCYDSEKPTRTVQISDFSISKYEVTQAQWRAVMGSDPSYNKGCDNCPVEQVSWNDVQEFIQKLNALTGQHYRLPTEAEWEYAARGGNNSRGYLYSGSNNIDEVAWYGSNAQSTRPVGGKKPNELGLYDMSGNVWEWVQDWYGTYPSRDEVNPKGPASASNRVGRGGSWYGSARYCRAGDRNSATPTNRNFGIGFRLAL